MKGMGIVLGVALASVSATAATETVNGLTWTYSISGNAAVIGGSAGQMHEILRLLIGGHLSEFKFQFIHSNALSFFRYLLEEYERALPFIP